jgi:tyrosine-protein phosphatase YwqE
LIDLHSHILPGLDDRARQLEDSLEIPRGEAELVHMIGSDAHIAGIREVGLSAARDAVGDEVVGQWLTQDVPRAVVEGGPLPPRPEMRKRRGFRLRLLR